MGRSKLKKLQLKKQQEKPTAKEIEESTSTKEIEELTSTKVPIDNLPEKFLWMHVKSGTKMRNILDYALKEFPNYNSIVWTGIGHGLTKVISCAEIFKRKHEGLHQVTKLCYVSSEKSKDIATETRRIPEIHILLTKDIIEDTTELGYQAPGNCGTFPKREDAMGSKMNITTKSTDNISIDRQSPIIEKSGKRKYVNKSKKNMDPPSKKKKN